MAKLGLVFVALPLAGVVCLGLFYRGPVGGELGQPVAVFELPRIGESGQLGAVELRGKLVVVSFWASWCGPCSEEARLLEEAWRRYQGEGVVVLGVNVQDTEPQALTFLRRQGITYPTVRDNGLLAASFGVTGIPESYFIDGRWRLVGVNRGDELGADQRHGWVIRQAIYPPVLERRIETLIATRPGETTGVPRREG